MTNIINKPLKYTTAFIKHNAVFCIAAVLALITCFIIPPDEKYIEYFDFKTLVCLFCTLAVVCALKNIRFFTILARAIVRKSGTLRTAITTLIFITFFGSMLIANDMALLTFLPLGYYVLNAAKKEEYMAYTFILQNIAANLGGMLTPFGNPQNLYMYTKFNIPTFEFIQIMFIPFIASTAMILICCMLISKEKIVLANEECEQFPKLRAAFYIFLFALSIIIVFRVIPYLAGLIIIVISLLFADRKAIAKVDYSLLGTFACMFVFAGNMSRIDFIRNILSSLLEQNTLIYSTLSCQIISNVPSAVLLSQFTDNYFDLLRGVNIGGTGTLIASLASLITFREYTTRNPGKTASYVGKFSLINFIFLIVLIFICSFM